MRRLYRAYEASSLLISVISGLTIALAYGLVADRGIHGQLTAGDLTAVIAAFATLSQQISLITASAAILDQNATFLDDYFAFLSVKPLLALRADPVPLPEALGEGISFSNVHFRYPGSPNEALSGLDLVIEPGQLVALVGENGAGKTSIVKLLLRFYDPDAGSVSVGGVDLKDCDPTELRSRIGVLFQDYATYELSARENVIFGRAEVPADELRIWGAIEAARAAGVVKDLPAGLDSKVGRLFDGGHDLSGGEWQRLALARLLYRNADIWVLDEPTSSLDPEAEAAIFAELRENLRGRMGIVISHRFSTVRIADCIAVVEDGRVSELGTHDELMALHGRYAELFELQAAAYR
jgi:ATP-binding cassette subfamily B protein